jgi:hypothetical protein
MNWWHWVVFGIVLIAFELLSPGGFYILFFGLAALVVGALTAAHTAGPLWTQWLLFSVLAVVSLLLFRKGLLAHMKIDAGPAARVDALVGDLAVPLEAIAPGAVGRVEMRGAAWSARNAGPTPVAANQRCRVVAVDGLLLEIRAE